MRSEYERIFRRAKEDPGTAGDEGESNWASLLSDWLPADIHVATKGRILAADGSASPQVDVVLLAGDYPRKLREKKLYLAGGVLAAFECKNTLRKAHLPKLFANARKISELRLPKKGNFYGEGLSPISYGLLSHSHEWPPDVASKAIDAEVMRLHAAAEHPRHLPCLISISDLQTWQIHFSPLSPLAPEVSEVQQKIKEAGAGKWSYFAASRYMRWIPFPFNFAPGQGPEMTKERPNPIGEMILYLLRHLAHKDFDRSGMAAYYQKAGLSGGLTSIDAHYWDPTEVYSELIISILKGNDWSRLEKMGNASNRPLP